MSPAPDMPIRDAATVLVLRRDDRGPSVLMGMRGAAAAFMPSKFVFPGGAVDPADAQVALARPLAPVCRQRLQQEDGVSPEAIAAAALRELAEETGLLIGQPD
ncbi:NUDIX domain-containing protein, partial [Paracoccus liaowanqingii]